MEPMASLPSPRRQALVANYRDGRDAIGSKENKELPIQGESHPNSLYRSLCSADEIGVAAITGCRNCALLARHANVSRLAAIANAVQHNNVAYRCADTQLAYPLLSPHVGS